MTIPSLAKDDIRPAAERTRDALAELAVWSEETNDYAAAREVLEASGLTAIRVPKSAGGPAAPWTAVLDAVRIVAQADAGVAQLLQPQFAFTDAIAALPRASRADLYAEVLAGARIGNAASERGGRHAAEFRSVLRRSGRRYELNGTKYYATGSVGARWMTVIAADEAGIPALAYVRSDAPGVRILDDWNGIGQRGSGSGTAVLDHVPVEAGHVIAPWDAAHRPAGWHESGRLVHAAIDVGIAEGALRYGAASVIENPHRVPSESAHASLADDPTLRTLIGRLSARARAAGALLRESAAALDALQAGSRRDGASDLRAEAAEALSAVKALSADLALDAGTALFEWTGARQTAERLGADRFWRNARTHTLHDPVRLRYDELGAAELAKAARHGASQ